MGLIHRVALLCPSNFVFWVDYGAPHMATLRLNTVHLYLKGSMRRDDTFSSPSRYTFVRVPACEIVFFNSVSYGTSCYSVTPL